jgi:hypothetical protein
MFFGAHPQMGSNSETLSTWLSIRADSPQAVKINRSYYPKVEKAFQIFFTFFY